MLTRDARTNGEGDSLSSARRGFAALRRIAESIPRPDTSRPGVALDTGMPVVVLWASRFPLQHSCLGAFRTLGRAGVPVYAVVAEPDAPAVRSRYVTDRIVWQPHRGEAYGDLIGRLNDLGRCLGRRSLIVCVGDEMAVLVARHRDELAEHFVMPDVESALPERLADKNSLAEICRQYGFATPGSVFVDSMRDLEAVIGQLTLPVAVKSTALRGMAQSVENTTIVATREELLDRARNWREPFATLMQDYIPDEFSEDWFSHGYCDATATAQVVFTGRKVRCWPVRGGATAAAFTSVNPELTRLSATFCAQVGYRGIFDIDWRLDLRTGEYFLLDFNPRVGAQFRMFENDAGIDVVRAMHIDLSGRPIPAGAPIDAERFVVEPWNLMSVASEPDQPWTGGVGRARLAWWANDDPKPALITAFSQVKQSVRARFGRGYDAAPAAAWER